MTSAATFDAGPLSWVKGEIDLALERVAQGLQQFGANTADLTQIKFCRTHLHQVRGALTIVGLDGVTQFTDAVEALLNDLEAGRQPADPPRIALIGRAVTSIRRYLDDLLAGDPNQPLRLLDLYRQIAAARGQAAPAASELFFPDLSTRPQLPAITLAEDGAAQLKIARTRYQKGLLAFIKAPDTPIGALELKLASQMAASADGSPSLRGFWWAASGFFAALGEKSIAADSETKSLCTRIDQQLRQQAEGSRAVPEKLMRDVLFQVAIARSRNADILAIKDAYDLAALIPAADGKTVSQAAQLEPFLKRLKEIASASEEAWNKYCTGSTQALQTFCDAAAALDQGAERLAHTDLRRLTRAVASTANWIREDRSRHNDTIALEMATGILLIGNGVDNFTRLGADFVHQVDLMVARLHACIAGNPMPHDAEVPMLDEMTRRAQEKLLISQVVKEIQSSLGLIEQALDTFFREPEQKEQLAGCQKPISQIIGALSILGHGDAVTQLQDSARQISRFQASDYQPEQKDFEQVARQLSALGFFVEALQAGVSDYHAFIAGLEVKPSKVEAAAEQQVAQTIATSEPLAALSEPEKTASALPPADEPAMPITTDLPVVEPVSALPLEASAAETPAAPATLAEPEIDAELLEIFLEEANEVIATIGEQLEVLRSHPSDVDALTTLRRAFHTLKGSSRMVGLMAFGDVAWVIEQVHNLWLRQEKPVDASLIGLIEASQGVFSAWIAHLEGKEEALPDASELVALGDKLKGGETITAPGRPLPTASAELPVSEPEAVAASDEIAIELDSEPAADVPEVSFNLDLPGLEISEAFAEAPSPDTPPEITLQPGEEVVPLVLEASSTETATASETLQPPEQESGTPLLAEVATAESATLEIAPETPALDIDFAFDEEVSTDEPEGASVHSNEPDAQTVSSEAVAAASAAPKVAGTDDAILDFDFDAGIEDSGDVPDIDLVSLIEPISDNAASAPERVAEEGGASTAAEAPLDLLLEADEAPAASESDVDRIDLVSLIEAAPEPLESLTSVPPDTEPAFEPSPESEETIAGSAAEVASIDLVSLVEPPEFTEAAEVTDTTDSLLIDLSEPTTSMPQIDSELLIEQATEETSASSDESDFAIAEPDDGDAPATAVTTELPSELAITDAAETVSLPAEPAPEAGASAEAPAHTSGQTITVAPTLYQIFLEEAKTHIATLQRTFGELEIDPAAPTSHEMLRAAHTLGSISGTVGFQSALKVGHGIEAALLRRDKSANPASLEALETLRLAIAELEMMLAAIERSEPLGDAAAMQAQLGELYPCLAAETIEAAASTLASLAQPAGEPAPAIDEPLPDDQIDESLLPIFLEEAADLVSGINERLAMWAANPYDTDTIHALTRLLHTLKGSARMAGAMRLGALTHRLESSIESAHRAGGADPVLIAALQADFDDIAELSERLGQPAEGTSISEETSATEIATAAEVSAAQVDAVPGLSPEVDLTPTLTTPPAEEAAAGSDEEEFVAPVELPDEEAVFADVADATLALDLAEAAPPPGLVDDAAMDHSDELSFDPAPGITESQATQEAAETEILLPAFDAPDGSESPNAEPIEPVDAIEQASDRIDFEFDFAPAAVDLQDFSSNATFVGEPALELPAATEPTLPVAAAELPEDHLDPDLLPIFLEEAVEIVRTVYEQLDAWQAAPADGAASHGLARSLHTLKGSARMAGAMSLGALTHTLESRAEEAAKSGQASVALIEEMKHAFDAIAQIVERLQRGDSLSEITIELPDALLASAPATASTAAEEIAALADTAEKAGEVAPAPSPAPQAPAKPAAVVAPAAPAAVAAAVAAQKKDSDAAKPMLRVRADLIDGLVNDAGELSIARARIEGEMRSLKQSLLDLTENVIRLRRQLREIEIQAESQMQSRTAVSADGKPDFDPLELDRFTRFQEVTRMMAESVNDVATVQLNLLKNLDEANAGLAAQARLNRELQQALMSVRMVPFASITERLYRIVRQTAKELGKKADLDVQGAGIELDQNVINKMIGPLEHLLRNAISHGVEMPALRVEQGKDEMGEIRLSLRQEGNEVIITMRDDGAGLNFSRIREKAIAKGLMSASDPYDERKLTEMIFNSGFSTAEQVSQIAGRGVGMDVVMTEVTNLGGRIDVTSESGKGSVFRIYLPLTLAVTNAVIVRVGSHFYAIPSSMVDQVQEIKEGPLAALRDAGGADWLGNHYPFHFLPHLLGEPNALPEARRMYWVMYLHSGLQRVAVQVDELQSTHEIVVKNIGPQLARVVGIAGATVMGDGRVILILNPVALAARAPLVAAAPAVSEPVLDAEGQVIEAAAPPPAEPEKAMHLPTVLVVDDSLTVRKITSRLLAREGYQVMTAKDGQDALEQLVEVIPDVILSDIEMPRMDGFEFARNLRADERLANIPVIMISSRTAEKHRAHAAELGVNHFLGKPYQEEELLGLIQDFIAQQRAG